MSLRQNEIALNRMVVVMICIGAYNNCDPLPGTQCDLKRLTALFRSKYNYKVFTNDPNQTKVTQSDVERVLTLAKLEFMDEEKDYQGIIVIFSGHGSET